MKKKLLVFDVDGTVWDSEKDVFLYFNHTLKENAGIEIDKDAFQELSDEILDGEEKLFKDFFNNSTQCSKDGCQVGIVYDYLGS